MRKSDIPVLSILKFLTFMVSFVAAELVTVMVIRFAVLFVELNFVSASVIRMCVLFAVSMGLWCFLCYKEGYRNGYFEIGESLTSAAIAAGVHVLLGCLFRFNPWVSGATRHISGFISLGSAYNSEERIAEIPFLAGVLTALGTAILMVALGLVAEYIGFRRRICHRELLTKENH